MSREQRRESDAIRKDISTARSLIEGALTRYVKKNIGARNKKQVEDQATLFAELDAREVARRNAGRYADRVTELLRHAMDGLGSSHTLDRGPLT